ncbi:hypothetical protein ACFV0H_32510 [Streptomyces erythrochromogenes]|uniref:Uncharacterized protein n=1 Tax=Streptomyces erythrochromogenes TaxID=285574 RepID=A0ABZ1QNK6_9ACTN|nr:hypothetical protein [Streptomyces erythrochromogenes]MCX5583247.1 hypothetical protein [Streptomyces erythrochromogenes]
MRTAVAPSFKEIGSWLPSRRYEPS